MQIARTFRTVFFYSFLFLGHYRADLCELDSRRRMDGTVIQIPDRTQSHLTLREREERAQPLQLRDGTGAARPEWLTKLQRCLHTLHRRSTLPDPTLQNHADRSSRSSLAQPEQSTQAENHPGANATSQDRHGPAIFCLIRGSWHVQMSISRCRSTQS